MNPENTPWQEALWPWQELRGVRIVPVILNQGPIDPGATSRNVTLPFYTWWWLEKGSVKITASGGRYVVPPRHWVLIPAGLARHQDFSADAVISSVNFAARWPNGLPLLQLPGLVIHKARPDNALVETARLAHREAGTPFSSRFVSLDHRRLSLGACMRLFSLVDRFVALLIEQPCLREVARCAPATGDSRLDYVLDHLSGHLRAGPLAYDEWRKAAGISRPQLDRLARENIGYTLREHRDHLLLAEIHRRLSIDHSSLKRHAVELGFVDSSHFSRWVKQRSGVTPKSLVSLRS